MKTGIEIIAEERERQINEEGFTIERDHELYEVSNELAIAGGCYALAEASREHLQSNEAPLIWPWAKEWWKPSPDNRIKELAKAGALIAAQIDNLIEKKIIDGQLDDEGI
jgi:hypothetical protein